MRRPSAQERRWLADLTPEERRMVREEDDARALGQKLVVKLGSGKEDPDALFDRFVQPKIDRAIRIVYARHALPGEVEAPFNDRCLLCKIPVVTGSKARRHDTGQLMHSACVEEMIALGILVEKHASLMKKYDELLAIRARANGARRGRK